MRVYVSFFCSVVIVLAVLMNCARTTEEECEQNLMYSFYLMLIPDSSVDESTDESTDESGSDNSFLVMTLLSYDDCMKESKKKRVFSIMIPR